MESSEGDIWRAGYVLHYCNYCLLRLEAFGRQAADSYAPMSMRPSLGLRKPPVFGLGIYFTGLGTLFVPVLISIEPRPGKYGIPPLRTKPGRWPLRPSLGDGVLI